MKSFARVLSITLVLIIITAVFAACSNGVNKAKIDYGHTEIYTKEDMDSAIGLIRSEVSRMSGLKRLINIRYSSDDCNSEKNVKWMNDCVDDASFTQCIMFTTDFTTGSNTTSLNPNDRYTGWEWWLARTDGGEWHVVTSGYG